MKFSNWEDATGSGGVRRNALRVLVVAEFALALTLLATGGLALARLLEPDANRSRHSN